MPMPLWQVNYSLVHIWRHFCVVPARCPAPGQRAQADHAERGGGRVGGGHQAHVLQHGRAAGDGARGHEDAALVLAVWLPPQQRHHNGQYISHFNLTVTCHLLRIDYACLIYIFILYNNKFSGSIYFKWLAITGSGKWSKIPRSLWSQHSAVRLLGSATKSR